MYVHYYAIKLLYYYVNCTPVIMSLYQLISFSYQCIYVFYIIQRIYYLCHSNVISICLHCRPGFELFVYLDCDFE